MKRTLRLVAVILALAVVLPAAARAQDEKQNTPPKGFTALFNGKDLAGWKGLVGNPKTRAAMSKEQLAEAQKTADQKMRDHWAAEEGVLVFDGKGDSICTAKDYGDFELYVDWKIEPKGDSGIYLRGTPQVQIWDPDGAAQNKVGSGGLFNNQKNPKDPLARADKPVREWNTFFIRMAGERVTIHLNGQLVVDNTVLENYWERDKPIYATGQIELQNHGNTLYFRNIYVRELVTAEQAEKIGESAPLKARAEPKSPRTVLAYTRAAGFVHSSIPHGAHAVDRLGRQTGAFKVVVSDDREMFAPDRLKEFDAVVLCNTTGNWLEPRKEDLEGKSPEEQQKLKDRTEVLKKSLVEFVRGGKGLAGFHSASDSNYNWPEFGDMIGGYFDGHPWHEKVAVKVEESSHPLLAVFQGQGFDVTDEIYQFKTPYSRDNLRVLLSLDASRFDVSKGKRQDKDFAVAWVHEYGQGRVFYSSLGHREEIYWNPKLLQFYLDGIQYALGDFAADATPSAKVK
ncbi:MAG: ThuA domain-containing protein [Planctomycetia bacterium]|nr:ThuA domain-containing protein [Planctomycetia bacterium]